MAIADFQEYLKLIPIVNRAPQHAVWLTFDAEADTLYVNFKKPSYATDSEMTDDDVIVRYEGNTVSVSRFCTPVNGHRRRHSPILSHCRPVKPAIAFFSPQ
ncbi:MAG: DUF2283 domain-containing protein [Nitrospira sp.]|nr:DUF2283 domain-containing protein [Nitrospira sp.]